MTPLRSQSFLSVCQFSMAALVALMLSPFCSHAALSWDRTLVQYQAKIGEEVIAFEFAFSNQTDHPIKILSVKPSCGCTTATPDKERYASGERGTLHVVFDGRGLFNLQEKTIQVVSDDAPGQPTFLNLRVTIPFWLKFTPQILSWPVGSEAVEKEALITLNPADGLRIVDVSTNDPTFRAILRPDADGRTFHIVVVPDSTRAAHDAGVNVKVVSATLATRIFVVVARVR